MDTPELQELVDAPRERLDVEYKAWLDLTDRETSAKLAKHLCALANFFISPRYTGSPRPGSATATAIVSL